MYALLADLVAALHAAYVLFVVAGELLILFGWVGRWTWTRNWPFRLAHLAAVVLVAVEAWTGVLCPLTVLENRLRELAGSRAYDMSFLGYWIDRLLYYQAPAWVFTLVYSLFSLLVVVTFVAYPPRRRAQ